MRKRLCGAIPKVLGLLVLTTGVPVVSAVVLPAQVAGAVTLHVVNCSDSGPGSLRADVATAASGDSIKVPLSCPLITLTSGYIDVATNVTIKGPGANGVAVSGNNASTVFTVESGVTATISDLTVENGSSSAYSAGGINNLGTLTVKNTILTNNQDASDGAGAINNGGSLVVNRSTLSNNRGYIGGGIYSNNGATATVTESALSNNGSVTAGNGIFNNGTLTVNRSTLSGNSTPATYGGGIFNNRGTATVIHSTLSGNSAGDGGGIYDNGVPLTVENSTLSGNSAFWSNSDAGYGGGIYTDQGHVAVTKSTVSNNSANNGGGAIFDEDAAVTISRGRFSHNTDPSTEIYPGIFTELGGTVTVSNNTIFSP